MINEETRESLNVKAHIKALLSSWKTITTLTLSGALLGGGVNYLRLPLYEATAVVSTSSSFPLKSFSEFALSDKVLYTVLHTSPVDKTKFSTFRREFSTKPTPDLSLQQLYVRNADSFRAMRLSIRWTEVLIDEGRRIYGQHVDGLEVYEAQLETSKHLLEESEKELKTQPQNVGLLLQYYFAQNQYSASLLLTTQARISRQKQLDVIQVVSPAVVPTESIRHPLFFDVGIGFLLGLMISVLIELIVEWWNGENRQGESE